MKYLIVFNGGTKTIVESNWELDEFCENMKASEFIVDDANGSIICTKHIALVKKLAENNEK